MQDATQEESCFCDTALELSPAGVSRVYSDFWACLTMQQNQHCLYPPVFWTNSSSIISGSDCAPAGLCHIGNVPRQDACPPLPVPERRRPGGSSDGTCLCFLVVILLVLLALTGASLALFQIFRLQQELDMLRQVTSVRLGSQEMFP